MILVSTKQKKLIEDILNACQIRLTAKVMDKPVWFVPLQGILIEKMYFKTQLSLLNEARDWYIEEIKPKDSPSILTTETKGLRNLKVGRWYKNPNHTSMKYGRIKSITIISRGREITGEHTFYNHIKFDKRVTDKGELMVSESTQSNHWFDDEMIEVSELFIKDKYG